MWQVYALVFSLIGALAIYLNHVYQIDGVRLIVMRTPFMLLFGLPFFIFLPLPTSVNFYMFSVLSGMLTVVADALLFNAAARHGARLASLNQPVKIFFVFCIWLAIDAAQRSYMLDNPLILLGILLCFTVMAVALLCVRQNDASFAAFIMVLPAGILFGLEELLVRFGLEGRTDVAHSLMFVIVGFSVSGVLAFVYGLYRDKGLILYDKKKQWVGSAIIGVLILFGVGIYNLALAEAPNPAYPSAIITLSILWLTIYYRYKRNERNNLVSGIAMMASAMGVLLLTS